MLLAKNMVLSYENHKFKCISSSLEKLSHYISSYNIVGVLVHEGSLKSSYNHNDYDILHKIGRHRKTGKYILRTLSPDEIITLYDKSDHLKNVTLRGQAKKVLSSYFSRRYKLPISKISRIKNPASSFNKHV